MPSIKIEPHHKELKIENLNTIRTALIYQWQLVNVRKRKKIMVVVPPNLIYSYNVASMATPFELFTDNANVKFEVI